MTDIGRRQFCALLGAGLAGAVALLSACSDDDSAAGSAGTGAATGVLAGLSFVVHKDPG